MEMVLRYAWMLPQLLVCALGLVLVIVHWSRHPSASILAFFLGLALIGLNLFSSIGIDLYIRNLQETGGADIGTVLRVTGILRSILDAAGMTLLLFAIYAGRGSAPVTAQIVPSHKQF